MSTGYLKVLFAILFIFVGVPTVFAAELYEDHKGLWRTEVLEVLHEEERIIPETNTKAVVQELRVKILEGPKAGQIIDIENDYFILKAGEKFFLSYLVSVDGDELYQVQEPDRRVALWFFIGLFAVVVVGFGGVQGLKSLLSLAGSFVVIFAFLFPRLLAEDSILWVSFLFSALVAGIAMYVTHGVNRKTTAAFLGTVLVICITIILATAAVHMTHLTGFSSEESVYLNLNTGGSINFSDLLLAGIIIGTLGILDDIAITQASAVEQIYSADPGLSRRKIYKKAVIIGKEHVAALVNTLALAYTGASLPLLLWFYNSGAGSLFTLNREIFATEIVRTIVGSIGLILAVPVATGLAVLFLVRRQAVQASEETSAGSG